jgi:outer membrane receptor protein involved in Fe transport
VNTFQWYDGITWSKGKHNIKAGGDIRRHRADAFLGTRLNNSYTFTGQFSGDGFADFLLGDMASSSIALSPNETGRFRRTMLAFYVLDDWKVSPKLTLNVGLRYEYAQVPVELSGLTPSFDPTLANGQGGLRFPKQNKDAEPFYRNVRPDLGFGYLDRETLFTPDKKDFAPRFGFAYRPFGGTGTVIRGGYGIFYSEAQMMNLVQNSVTGPPAQVGRLHLGLDQTDVNLGREQRWTSRPGAVGWANGRRVRLCFRRTIGRRYIATVRPNHSAVHVVPNVA